MKNKKQNEVIITKKDAYYLIGFLLAELNRIFVLDTKTRNLPKIQQAERQVNRLIDKLDTEKVFHKRKRT